MLPEGDYITLEGFFLIIFIKGVDRRLILYYCTEQLIQQHNNTVIQQYSDTIVSQDSLGI